jgi:hypothetical protein
MDYASDTYGRAYDQLLTVTGAVNDDRSIDVTKEDFKKGSAIYAISLTPADPECPTFDVIQTGTLRVAITFKNPTTKAYRAMVMCEFEKVYHINQNRNVLISD